MKTMERRVQAMEAERQGRSPWGPVLDHLSLPELEHLNRVLPRLLAGEQIVDLDQADKSLILKLEAMRCAI